jgi:hypothetical protein
MNYSVNPNSFYSRTANQTAQSHIAAIAKPQKEFIIKKSSPTQHKTKMVSEVEPIQPPASQQPRDEQKRLIPRSSNNYPFKSDGRQILTSNITSLSSHAATTNNQYGLSMKPESAFKFDYPPTKIEHPPSRSQLSRGVSMELEEKNRIEEERRRKEDYNREQGLKRQLDDALSKLEAVRRQYERLDHDTRIKDARIHELEEENATLKRKLAAKSKPKPTQPPNRNVNRANGRPMDPFEETKGEGVDDNEIKSLQLALRLEAENFLLGHFNQIAMMRQPQFDPNESINLNSVNPDNMTYEQLLQLGEKMGSVSKGLTKEDIKKLQKYKYERRLTIGHDAEKCSVCFCDFEKGETLRKLPCTHQYHSKCIKPWLLTEKSCPVCKKDVVIV